MIAIVAKINPKVWAPESPKNNFAGCELKKYIPTHIPSKIEQNKNNSTCPVVNDIIKKNRVDTPLIPIVNPSILSIKLNAFVMANNQNIVKLIFNRFAISGLNEKKNSGELNKFICTPL